MKRVRTLIVGVIAALMTVSVFAGEIGVVDMQKIFKSAPQIQQINSTLTQKFANRKQKIIEMGKQLQTQIQKFQKNKAVMSASDLATMKKNITAQEMKLRQMQAQFQQDFFKAQNKRMSEFMTKVRGIVKTIAAKKDLDMVLPKNSVLYSQGGADITPQVITALQ